MPSPSTNFFVTVAQWTEHHFAEVKVPGSTPGGNMPSEWLILVGAVQVAFWLAYFGCLL